MAKIIMTVDDPTPEQMRAQLRRYIDHPEQAKFPFPPGTEVTIRPGHAATMHIMTGSPVIVVAAPPGTDIGAVAFFNAAGHPATVFIPAEFVVSPS